MAPIGAIDVQGGAILVHDLHMRLIGGTARFGLCGTSLAC